MLLLWPPFYILLTCTIITCIVWDSLSSAFVLIGIYCLARAVVTPSYGRYEILYLHTQTLMHSGESDLMWVHVCTYMWQSQVEIEHYCVAYFNHITAFEAL